jgi:16S rRNA (cytidine1402-2'-O)-methyltransferase
MLSIVSTPIGNLDDISLRAIKTLKEADVILAEDTRHTGLLLRHFEIPHKPLVSLYDEVEGEKLTDLLALVASDQKIALVSDAGTPLISDPGYKLVREALRAGVKVESVPGPCAAIAALTVSGLPPDKFTFWGFPKKNKIAENEGTNIYYVSPHKLLKFLKLLKPEQEIVICRELTKIFEETWFGKTSEAMIKFSNPKGEFVVLWHTSP